MSSEGAIDLSAPGGLTAYARTVADLMHQRDHPDIAACNMFEWLLARDAVEARGSVLSGEIPSMPAGQCFENAADLALTRSGLTYVEGVGSGLGAIHHAWCIDPDGRVIDPTWDGHEPAPTERFYLGVPVDDDVLRRWLVATRHWGLLGGDPRAAGILLRRGSIELALEEIAWICLGCGRSQCDCEVCDDCEEKAYLCDCCPACGEPPDAGCDCYENEEGIA